MVNFCYQRLLVEPDTYGLTRVNDLSRSDLSRIRNLALLELTTILDRYDINISRRKGKRKYKGKTFITRVHIVHVLIVHVLTIKLYYIYIALKEIHVYK